MDQFCWFDYWLKGADTGIMKEPAVYYYVMGDVDDDKAPGNKWRTSDTWPVPVKATKFYLNSDGVLREEKPGKNSGVDTFFYDPADPVPTRGGQELNLPPGPMDQRSVERRQDVLTYSTPALKEPVEVTGRIKARLLVSSTAADADFTAKLCDVYPDGRSMLLTDGILRAKYRNSFEKPEPLEPGKVYEIEIDLWSTSIVFNKGHKIRIAVSSSNFPRFEANPNSAVNSVYCSSKYPSSVVLPVVPQAKAKSSKKNRRR
jgi:putative CocE/NonD family hydrolase